VEKVESDLDAAKRSLSQKENKEAIVQRMQNIHEVNRIALAWLYQLVRPLQRLQAKADAAWVSDHIAGALRWRVCIDV
jgi:hypothetical protein